MIYSNFIGKTSKYLKSVRVLKNYISFDMIFPTTWVMLKNNPNGVEILQNEGQDGKQITSFVCENKKELIDGLENTLDLVIKTNVEREEKERLFKTKVLELKSIFENQNLENLKGLKFDIEELTKFIENETDEINTGVTETTEPA
jgi:hypothetical protein